MTDQNLNNIIIPDPETAALREHLNELFDKLAENERKIQELVQSRKDKNKSQHEQNVQDHIQQIIEEMSQE